MRSNDPVAELGPKRGPGPSMNRPGAIPSPAGPIALERFWRLRKSRSRRLSAFLVLTGMLWNSVPSRLAPKQRPRPRQILW